MTRRAAAPLVGVLAIQGGFEAHERMLRRLGAEVRQVRAPEDLGGEGAGELESPEALVIPGGESTAMTLGIERERLREPLRRLASNVPVLGSCAGLIMLDRAHLDVIDMLASRNAFGRQLRSFEADVEVKGLAGPPLRGVFIRAPWIEDYGEGVEILSELDGHPIAARQGNVIAVSFHSELTDDDRIHKMLLDAVDAARQRRTSEAAR